MASQPRRMPASTATLTGALPMIALRSASGAASRSSNTALKRRAPARPARLDERLLEIRFGFWPLFIALKTNAAEVV